MLSISTRRHQVHLCRKSAHITYLHHICTYMRSECKNRDQSEVGDSAYTWYFESGISDATLL